jgi:hypothetical protein
MPDRIGSWKMARSIDSSALGELDHLAVAATSVTEREIRACIDRFLVELRELLQRRALEAVRTRFEGGAATSDTAPIRRRAVPERGARGRASRAQAKHSPAVVAKMAELVLVYVTLHPNIDIAGLRSGLGLSSEELRLPLRRLIEEGQMRTSGQRRGTRYLPAAAAPGGRGARGRTTPPARRRKPAPADLAPQAAPAIREQLPAAPVARDGPSPDSAAWPEPASAPAAEPELATASA